jgi:hypothetical protein
MFKLNQLTEKLLGNRNVPFVERFYLTTKISIRVSSKRPTSDRFKLRVSPRNSGTKGSQPKISKNSGTGFAAHMHSFIMVRDVILGGF